MGQTLTMRRRVDATSERLLIVSNRAPYSLRRRGRQTELAHSIGGLASTLDDALRARGGVWLAWAGSVARSRRGKRQGPPIRSLLVPGGSYRLRLLALDDEQVDGYYHGLANRS